MAVSGRLVPMAHHASVTSPTRIVLSMSSQMTSTGPEPCLNTGLSIDGLMYFGRVLSRLLACQ